MRRLGYARYVAQGGDVGSQVTDAMGRLSLDGLIGIHTNLLTPALGDAEALSASPPSIEERAALDALAEFHATGVGYFVEQATRPQTIGYALLDSPRLPVRNAASLAARVRFQNFAFAAGEQLTRPILTERRSAPNSSAPVPPRQACPARHRRIAVSDSPRD